MLLKNSKISLLIAVIVCHLTLNTAAAQLVQRTRISRVMRLPVNQNESETVTTTTTTTVTPIEAKEENEIAEEAAAAIDKVDKDAGNNDEDHNDDDADDDDDDEDNDDAAGNENDESSLKTDLQADSATTSLSVWSVVRGLWSLIRDGISESFLERSNTAAGRTFAKIRRLQMMMIPLIFKFGILTAMVSLLVVLGFKTIFLLKVILFFNLIGLLAKFFTLKLKLGQHIAAPTWGHASWNYEPISHGYASDYGAEQHGPSKEIHLHIHGGQLQSPQHSGYSQLASYGGGAVTQGTHGWDRRSDPYSAYAGYAPSASSATVVNNEQLSTAGTTSFLPVKYDPNNRVF